MRSGTAFVCAVLFGVPVYAQDASVPAAACERLAASLGRSAAADRPASVGLSGRVATRLSDTTVTSAQPVAAGEAGPWVPRRGASPLPAFCRVALTIKPSPDSDIKSEVWLPMSGWNGKFLAVGNGGWGGSIQYAALADGLRRGYAVASTDTGHTGTDASFAVGHPEKLIDFGYRAVHQTAIQGKATTKALYGVAPRLSYFNGCSAGGRQAFMEAQRFPDDFDGIVAGAPGYNRTDAAFQTIGMAQATHVDPESFIPASKYPLIHRAAVNACDTLDGLKDGLITDPTRCRFDPGILACKGRVATRPDRPALAGRSAAADRPDGPGCLTMPQVVAARKMYAPVIDPKTGEQVSTGLERGSELHWGAVAGDRPHDMYHDLLKFVVFKDPTWDYRTLDVGKHLELARKADSGILAATSTDLKPFVSRGNKLLMYHGWEDQNIPPRSSVNYYSRLLKTMGREQVDGAVRLYMVPGMGHCSGGDGPSEFDMLGVLEAWREHGRAPAAIPASKVENGRVTRTRPLCPYPQIARYKGGGSIDQAENFACTAP